MDVGPAGPFVPPPEPPSDPGRRPVATFVPDRRFTAGAGVGALAALVALLLSGEATGRLLAGLVVVLLLAYVVCDLVFSPRLVASVAGIDVRSPLTRARLSWDQIESVHVDTRARLGLRSRTLEIDAGAVLVVLSRRALGTDPEAAARLIGAFRPT